MKELPPRSTRGKRMNDLIGEEKDFDGMFWEQALFKETQSDDEYKSESEKGDKYDDDFFHEESSEGETQEPKAEKNAKLKKTHQKVQKKKKRLKIAKIPGVTQKEMLEQAAIVEMYNTHDLKKLLNLEANSKTTIIAKKEKLDVTWRYLESIRSGKRKITIWHTEPLQTFTSLKPKKKICVITGQVARYTDPLTNLPYATKEAFKKIRENLQPKPEKLPQKQKTLESYFPKKS